MFEWRDAPRADFAVIGDPVAHSLSPKMHNAAYAHLELPLRYTAIRVERGEVASALEHLRDSGYRGVNVTVPHKEEVLGWIERYEPMEPMPAQELPVNTVELRGRTGTNTDAPGFLRTLASALPSPLVGKRVLLLGAGGSARALALGLESAGYEVSIFNRTRSKAGALVAGLSLRARVLERPDPDGVGLIVNATASGISGEAPEVLWERAPSSAVAYDLYYTAGPTRFMHAAERHGLQAIDGRAMLMEQGALSFEWWLGETAPREVMMKAVL
ncbi:MAG TPA: shikimate dehydrogenase [Fimbriimonadaceae bacterium]|nr:shikimate dehydrogenase [Fimbriimonadaceae bacterium]